MVFLYKRCNLDTRRSKGSKRLPFKDATPRTGTCQRVGTNCPPPPGGPQKENFANLEGMFRIIQSIPSKKAEPFKRWLAQVGAERIHQMQDPELGIQQSLQDYKRLGYSDNWINQRLKSIEIRMRSW